MGGFSLTQTLNFMNTIKRQPQWVLFTSFALLIASVLITLHVCGAISE